MLSPNNYQLCTKHGYAMLNGTPCPKCSEERLDRIERDPNGKDPHAPGAKLDAGKVKAGVLEDFSLALWEVARVGTFGAEKYTRGGWQEVPNGQERYKDAKWRHLLKKRHEENDQESDIEHMAHEAWNILAELELKLRSKRAAQGEAQ